MFRGVGAAIVAAAALLAASPALATPGATYGIQDDAWLLYGPGTLPERVTTLQSLGVGLVRVTLRFDQIAPERPSRPRDYHWGAFGRALDALHTRGVTTLVTLYGSPRWANGGASPATLPTSGFGEFAAAAAGRFPWIRLWTAWNEPNSRTFAVPVSPADYVRNVLNPAFDALHAASPGNRVAGGVTSPRKTPTGMTPYDFMKGMSAAGARLDAYAQNPYPVEPGETPTHVSCLRCGYFTMATLPQIRQAVNRFFGTVPIWFTEYGYQTNPPDELIGVSYAQQARYIGEAALRVWRAPRVTILVQFLVRDEPELGGWQSGLFTVAGQAKPAYHAFALPLAQASRQGSRVVLWGQIRPGTGVRTYVLQRAVGSTWLPLGKTTKTQPGGTFTREVDLRPGAQVRIYAPAVGWTSPPLTVS
jgi:hypothetical protein